MVESQDAHLERELHLLDEIEKDPDVTQANLAQQLGVAVGTVNWHIKRMIQKGYIKVSRAERKKLKYILTAEGLALRARLTVDYVEQSFALYRRVRLKVIKLLEEVSARGFSAVRIVGDIEDMLDVCHLTCVEQGFEVGNDPALPTLKTTGLSVDLVFTGEDENE